MEAGTWVALVLGVGGFGWAIVQFFVNRRDTRERDERDRLDAAGRARLERDAELERRWLFEKRRMYVRAQEALTNLLDAEVARRSESTGSTPRQKSLEAVEAAWLVMNDVYAELDLLAPDAVREAVFAADETLGRIATDLVLDGEWVHHDAIGAAEDACRAALNAMRADLGVGPVREWRTPVGE